MKILQRYILREFLVPLFYCLTGFVSIYVLFELFGSFSRMLEANVSLKDAVLYFFGYLAPYFHYIVPAALMLATLYTMWMMCRHSELVAMRASGVSFLAIVKPLLGSAVVMALLVVGMSEWFMPRYADWAAQMKTNQFRQDKIVQADNIVYRNTAAGRTWNVDEMLAADGSSLKSVRISIDRPGGVREMTVSAERADFLDGEWWLSGLRVQHYDANGREMPSVTPKLDALPLRNFPEFNEEPRDFLVQNHPWRFNSIRNRLRFLKMHPDITDERRADLLYDTWAQIMAPFACLVITLFAIPAGIASGRQSVFRGIVGALGMYFAFYGVTIGCMILGKNAVIPPVLAAILPAAVFLVLGVRAFLKQR